MGETKISAEIKKMIAREFPGVQIDRHHCGLAKGYRGGMIKLGSPGWPDLIGYAPDGRFIGIEVKDPAGTTNKARAKLQEDRRADINSKGGIGILTHSVEHCRAELKRELP